MTQANESPFSFLNDSGLTPQQLAEHLVRSGVISKGDIQRIWKSLNAPLRTAVGLAESLAQEQSLTPYQAQVVTSDQPQPLVLGSYLIQDQLGQGGMGQVFRAIHRKMKREVALKLISGSVLKDENAVRRFNREVEAAARLSHPNIVTSFDAGEVQGVHYLVMELVLGEDLSHVVRRRGRLSVKRAIDYTIQAAQGLAYAHRRGIVHRDIKPANLLLDQDGTIKILDMGLARFEDELDADQSERLTGTGMVMGTIDFMAPEQAFDSKTADARSDIYSLGCTLFFMISGRAVFEDNTVMKRLLAHRERPIPSLVSHIPSVTTELHEALERMLSKRPSDRYQSMEELIDALKPLHEVAIATPERGNFNLGSAELTPTLPPTIAPQDPAAAAVGSVEPTVQLADQPGSDEEISDDTDRISTVGDTIAGQRAPDAGPLITVQTEPRSKASRRRKRKPESESGRLPDRRILGLIGATVIVAAIILVSIFRPSNSTVDDRQTTAQATALPTAVESSSPKLDTTPNREPNEDTNGSDIKSSAALTPPIDLLKQSSNSEAPNSDLAAAFAEYETKPEPGIDANKMPAAAADPINAKSSGKSIVVGTGPDHVADLPAAIEAASPYDTILIRHRGPLELPPVDLTGKTPLTIVGDTIDGTDYWPIIRQSILPADSNPSEARAWMYGDDLDVTFRKLHLGLGGHRRQPIASGFQVASGQITFDQCTVTASASDDTNDPIGYTFPLVTTSEVNRGDGNEVQLTLTRTLLRGGKLDGLLRSDGATGVAINADHLVWAGGFADWLQLGKSTPVQTTLKQSTLYNLRSLCRIDEGGAQQGGIEGQKDDPPLQFIVDQSVIVGRDANTAGLFRFGDGNGASAIDKASLTKRIMFKGQGIVFNRFSGLLPLSGREKRDPKVFADLFELNPAGVVEADPMFRVRPTGIELQESDARDLQVRLDRAARPPRGFGADIGASPDELPIALSCTINREVAKTGQTESLPRGRPRILRVHQRKGPYRTLEKAFAEVRDDEIIEIIDNATYVPKRDFRNSSAKGVLSSDNARFVTLRAVDDSMAKVVLSDQAQDGPLPAFHFNVEREVNHALFLIASNCTSLKIDGIYFETDLKGRTRHSFLYSESLTNRITNCRFVDLSRAPHAVVSHYWNSVIACLVPRGRHDHARNNVAWLENCIVVRPVPLEQLTVELRDSPIAVNVQSGAMRQHVTWRNCAAGSNLIAFYNAGVGVLSDFVKMERCTIFGWPMALGGPRNFASSRIRDCLFVCPSNPIPAVPAGEIDKFTVGGGNNAVWLASGSNREPNSGSLRLLPGHVLDRAPRFSGRASDDDLLKPFVLLPRQRLSTMASDGGSVGVRPEYFP